MRSVPGEDAPARSAAVSAEGPLPRLPCARRLSPVRPLLLFTTLVIAVARLPCGASVSWSSEVTDLRDLAEAPSLVMFVHAGARVRCLKIAIGNRMGRRGDRSPLRAEASHILTCRIPVMRQMTRLRRTMRRIEQVIRAGS